MKTSILISLAAFASWCMPVSAGAQETGVEPLQWLEGHWVSEKEGRWTEEFWTDARGGLMLGLNRSGRGEKATGFEHMRIAVGKDGAATFWGSPGGKPAVPFRLIAAEDNEAVFENAAHDFPNRIAYRRTGKTLVATVSGRDGANAMTWRFRKEGGE